MCFPLCIPNLRGLSDGFSAQHLPLCLPGQAPVTSPESLHSLFRVSWPWNCKPRGPVQGGRLMVTEAPPNPSREGPREFPVCVSGPWLPSRLAHLFSGPSLVLVGGSLGSTVCCCFQATLATPQALETQDPVKNWLKAPIPSKNQGHVPGLDVIATVTCEDGVWMSRGSAAVARCPTEGSANKDQESVRGHMAPQSATPVLLDQPPSQSPNSGGHVPCTRYSQNL